MKTNNHTAGTIAVSMIIALLAVIIALSGCYGERKAREQFAKAAIAYPEIPAAYCANEFPVKDSVIRDTTLTFDTLFIEGLSDTVFVQDFDTVRMTITKTLPGKVITNTVHIIDTIIRENTASVAACEIERSKLIGVIAGITKERDEYKGRAQKRGWIMWGLALLIAVIVGLNIYKRIK